MLLLLAPFSVSDSSSGELGYSFLTLVQKVTVTKRHMMMLKDTQNKQDSGPMLIAWT